MTELDRTGGEARTVILTGAGGAIGRVALRLLSARTDVVVLAVDRSSEALAAAVDELPPGGTEVASLAADVSSSEDLQRAVATVEERWGGLDAVWNLAAIGGQENLITDMPDEVFDEMLRVNAGSTWRSMKYCLPALLRRGGGSIVNTGSHWAVRGGPRGSAYTASKHAIVGMTKSVALEFARDGIRANVLSPGPVDAGMIREYFIGQAPSDPARARREYIEKLPNRRMADPEEIAAAGIWVLLDAPAHYTGQVLSVDGALTAG